MTIEFLVMGKPVPQPRHRITKFGGRYIDKDHPIHAYKDSIQKEFTGQYKGFTPLEGPVELTIHFLFPRTQNITWKSRPMPRLWHTKASADWDNCAKGVCDALNKLAYNDDSQICKVTVTKQICEGKEEAHTHVVIKGLSSEIAP